MQDEERERPRATSARAPIQWKAHEYVHTEKTSEWYWAVGLIAVAGSVGALLFNNVLFAIFILVAAFVLALLATQKPKHIEFAVTQRGIRIDTTLYPYSTLESFAIDESASNNTPKLILESRKIFAPNLIIPIEDVDPDDVHDFIANFLPEEDHYEPLTHRVMEWLGF